MPGVYATAVSAQGYVSKVKDIYGTEGQNLYANPFGNTSMLLKLSNGGVARISENRNIGWRAPETYISQFYGTDGCYEFAVAHHFLSHWDSEKKGSVVMQDVSRELFPDLLHPSATGYEKWAAAVKPYLDWALSDRSTPSPKTYSTVE